MDKKMENRLVFAWMTSLIAVLGSLYFSQIKLYEPCSLCWYQRIAMYPIVIILLVGIYMKDRKAALYPTVLSSIGFCISVYHYALQKVTFLAQNAPSCGRVPCSGQYINWFGFVTIPFLAGLAFLIIFICSVSVIRMERKS